jgi:hypothetical protein
MAHNRAGALHPWLWWWRRAIQPCPSRLVTDANLNRRTIRGRISYHEPELLLVMGQRSRWRFAPAAWMSRSCPWPGGRTDTRGLTAHLHGVAGLKPAVPALRPRRSRRWCGTSHRARAEPDHGALLLPTSSRACGFPTHVELVRRGVRTIVSRLRRRGPGGVPVVHLGR